MAAAAFIAATEAPCAFHARRAAGARVWDSDGEIRLDFDMGGGAIILGHAAPAVETAVANASAAAEADAAAALTALVPCAEAVRFAAEEAHALPAAIAAARRATGQRRALVWGPTIGPLADARDMAALVVDPLGLTHAELADVRRLATTSGAVLIFDEGVSGFRVHDRGAQGLNGVQPDLAVYGAGIANGRPIGAIAGRRDLIRALAEGDLPAARAQSLAAAAATLKVLSVQPAAPQLRILGAELQAEVTTLIERSGAARFFSLAGDPALPTPLFSAPQLEGLWLRETARRGLICFGPHGLSAAHGEAEIAALLGAYADILPLMVANALMESLVRRPLPPPSFPGSLSDSFSSSHFGHS